MQKTLPVIRKLTPIAAILLIFISGFGCGRNNNNSTEIIKQGIATSIPPERSEKDTSFNTLDDLLGFYQPRIISMSNRDVEVRKAKEARKSFKTDSTGILFDSSWSLTKERNKAIINYLLTHEKTKENFRGFTYLRKSPGVPVKVADSLFHLFPVALQKSIGGQYFLSWLDPKKSFIQSENYNQRILDFSFITTNGKKTTLKQITSRYILLDFWASWCYPCRQENAKLVKLKDLMPSQDKFFIVAISLDDNKSRWIKAAIDDKLNYLTISDLRGEDDSPIAKEFKVTEIPSNVLISKNGKILGHDLWGTALIEFVNMLP